MYRIETGLEKWEDKKEKPSTNEKSSGIKTIECIIAKTDHVISTLC